MSEPPLSTAVVSGPPVARRHVRGVGVVLFGLAAVALITPLASETAMARVGLLLLLAGLLEVYDGFRRARAAEATAAWYNGASTLLIGIVVLNSTTIVAEVFVGLLAAWFLFDAGRYGWRGVAALRRGASLPLRACRSPRRGALAPGRRMSTPGAPRDA